MSHNIENMLPAEIEKRSFEMIGEELGGMEFPPGQEAVVKRVIHTTADFEYAQNLCFSPGVIDAAQKTLRAGAPIITDTQMARAGINKRRAAAFGCEVHCFIADEDVAEAAREEGVTRSRKAVDKAARLYPHGIFVVGNAPTALIRLFELMEENAVRPALIVGVPVGFVHVVESKELILSSSAPHIVAKGRKGGSNVAAAICNALLYSLD